MFYWKNVVVLIALLAMAALPMYMLTRNNVERAYGNRLIAVSLAIAGIALSFLPLTPSLLLYAVLLILASTPKVPLAGTWLFLLVWTPSAGIYLGFGGLYLGVLTPMLVFSLALLLLYISNPAYQGRRGVDSSDGWLLAFLTIFWICSSLRGSWTDAARTLINYILAFGITYQVLSRARIQNAELTLRLLIYGGAAASLVCIFETIMIWPLYSVINDLKRGTLEGASSMMLFRAGIVRAYGPFPHPLAGSAIFGMIGVAFFALTRMRRTNFWVLALGGMIVLGLLATVSRSGILALSAGTATFLVLRGHKWLAALIIGIGITMLISTPILSQADAQGSATYRYSLMTDVPMLLGNYVWFGYREALANGMLASLKQGQGIIDLVNIYISLIIQGGVVSLVPYLIFLGTTIQRYRALRRAHPNRDQLLLGQACLSMQAGFVAMAPFIGSWSAPMLMSCVWTALLAALRAEASRAPLSLPAPAVTENASALAGHEPLPTLR